MNNPTPQTPAPAAPAADPAKIPTTASSPPPAKDRTATGPTTAAKGNDDVMSQPAKKS